MKSRYEVINKIKEYNIPVVLFNREPLDIDSIKLYNKVDFVRMDTAQAGTLQGKIIVKVWYKNNIMQYVMLIWECDSKEVIEIEI